MKRRLLLAALPALVLTTQAQTRREQRPVYRCGNTLSDRPCEPEATASAVGFDQPSDADRRAARERTQAEQARADKQERERLAAERAALRANTPNTPNTPSAPAKTLQVDRPAADPRVRHARRPKPGKPHPPAKAASG